MTKLLETARAVNEAGTPGPWIYDSYTTVHSGLGPVNYSDKKENDANLVRIAFFDTDTVSAMLDVIEAAYDHIGWCNKNGWDGVLVERVNEAMARLERLTEGRGEQYL